MRAYALWFSQGPEGSAAMDELMEVCRVGEVCASHRLLGFIEAESALDVINLLGGESHNLIEIEIPFEEGRLNPTGDVIKLWWYELPNVFEERVVLYTTFPKVVAEWRQIGKIRLTLRETPMATIQSPKVR